MPKTVKEGLNFSPVVLNEAECQSIKKKPCLLIK